MKKLIAVLLAVSMLLTLTACKPKDPEVPAVPTEAATEATEAPTTEATTEPTTVPTEPEVYVNPLNGEILDEPFTGRIFANTISNIPDALPHVGVVQADILMEMFVNNSIVRCLALFSDISDVDAIGSTRSTRLMFNDIAQHYDLILSHANGSSTVRKDFTDRGIDNINLDNWEIAQTGASYRDKEYKYGEHNLFGVGSGIMAYAESQGMRMSSDKDYGLTFTDDGTPADGEDASQIDITLTYDRAHKETTMVYDAELGKYVYNQYGKEMHDQITDEVEAFTNVIVQFTDITVVASSGALYHTADFLAGGEGYFACGGKIIPITWTCDGEDEPFHYFTADGQPLNLGRGNTYIAIAHPDSEVTWQ